MTPKRSNRYHKMLVAIHWGARALRSGCLGLLVWATPIAFASEPVPAPPRWLNSPPARPRLEPPAAPEPSQIPLPNPATMQWLLSQQELRVPERTRLIVFAPHPDDETLAAGGLIQRVLGTDGTVLIVFVTNGDGYVDGVRREARGVRTSRLDFIEYGRRRHDEALNALKRLGLRTSDALFLGFPDDGIDDLWAGHWSPARPYTSPYTRFDRPSYKDSLSRRVKYAGSDLEGEITATLRGFNPDWVLMPDPRDRHPDHCTTGVFVLDALRKLRHEGGSGPFERTQVLTYLVHSPDYPASPGWLKEIASAGVGGSPASSRELSATRWITLPLRAAELAEKQRALSAYQTQMQVMNSFLKQFLRPVELFGQLDAAQVMKVPRDYAARFRHPS